MSAERWRQVEDLYRAVCASDMRGRTNLLARAEPDVRREVESLLAHQRDAGPLDGLAVDLVDPPTGFPRAATLILPPGTDIGAYTILAQLGAGGMGVVYRAQDTRLGRDVAIKVLTSCAASDGDRRLRFEREARAIAALNHAHICTLHDIGHERVRLPDGEVAIDFLVMELVEGDTLAERLQRGPLPIERVLEYGIQIALALDKAHRQGIIHRDLKPANIMVTKAGVKLLDFGLARLMSSRSELFASLHSDESDGALTGERAILGTLHYMSPEQLEGREADARADIFAFGAVLYEMATGKKAFDAPTRAGVLTEILVCEPAAVSERQPLSFPALDHVVRECLAKSPDDRWQTAHDLVTHLKWIASGGFRAEPSARPAPRIVRRRVVVSVAAALAGGIALGSLVALRSLPAPRAQDAVRFELSAPIAPINYPGNLSISPDGRRIVFNGRTPDGRTALFLRSLDSPQARQLAGTEDARGLFWSPDSRDIAFFANGKLKRLNLAGGLPLNLYDSPRFFGGTWNADGVIVFSRGFGPLMRVSASGGEAVPVTEVDESRGGLGDAWPTFLPDGRRFLYLAGEWDLSTRTIYAGSLDSMTRTEVLRANARPVYASSGHLLFHRDTALFAQPFDAERLILTGEPTRVADGVFTIASNGFASYDVSQNGTLVYRGEPPTEETTLVWFDRMGRRLETVGASGVYRGVALSPDNRRIAFHLHQEPEGGDIWVVDRDRATSTRLTFSAHNWRPVWSDDGTSILFSSTRGGDAGSLYLQPSSGLGEPELLVKKGVARAYADDWSADGRSILYSETTNQSTGPDIWTLALDDRQSKPELQIRAEFDQLLAKFSPDGRWIAYESTESGRREIYVQPYGTGGGRWQISPDGGRYVRWARSGRELFYLKDDGSVMVVEVSADGAAFRSRAPRLLFKANPVLSSHSTGAPLDVPYDVTADGQRFLFTERVGTGAERISITVVLNWNAALEK